MTAPTTWTAPASGGTVADASVSFNTVTYAGGYWFSVTNTSGNIRLRYATDPTGTWTEATMPAAPGGTTSYNFDYTSGVVSDGTTWAFLALYFSPGTYTPRVIHTTNPAGTWSSYDPGVGSYQMSSLAYGNGVWALVGCTAYSAPYGPVIATSSSASGTYTSYTTASATGYDTAVLGSFNIEAIRYDGSGTWVTAGITSGGTEYARYGTTMSPPGSWSAPSSYSATGAFDANRLRYQNSHWTAIDNGGRQVLWTTSASGSWTLTDDTAHLLDSYAAELTYWNGYWVLVGGRLPVTKIAPAVAYTSNADPSTGWSAVDPTSLLSGFTWPGSSDVRLTGVATDGNYLVAGSQYFGELRYVKTTPTYLRQRQSPVRAPSRVSWKVM